MGLESGRASSFEIRRIAADERDAGVDLAPRRRLLAHERCDRIPGREDVGDDLAADTAGGLRGR
jgi:hypothetical protein